MTEKKEKVLHTRIPESLDEEIRGHASQLGVSVSNLVRNVLQNAFGLVDDIVADTTRIAQATRSARKQPAGEAHPPAQEAPPADQVLAWQEAVLNLNAVCERCNAILVKGTRAAVAIVDGSGHRPIRCLRCLEELSDESTDEPDTGEGT
jgi:hypothetical protein